MYERLTIRHPHPHEDFITIKETKQLPDTEQSRKVLNRLCDLEDKIEQGKILELPCSVGQTVYVPWKWGGQEGIASVIVECIQIVRDAKLCGFFIDMKSDDAAFNDVYGFWRTFADIGKTVFLDRASAEAKLREMEGDNNEQQRH